MLFGLTLCLDRSIQRKAAEVALGIQEAFAEVKSLSFLESLATDPLEAKAQHELQAAEAANRANRMHTETEP